MRRVLCGRIMLLKAQLVPTKNEIYITSLKMARGEMKDTLKNDNMNKDEMQH
jgi:hypothetical protein